MNENEVLSFIFLILGVLCFFTAGGLIYSSDLFTIEWFLGIPFSFTSYGLFRIGLFRIYFKRQGAEGSNATDSKQ